MLKKIAVFVFTLQLSVAQLFSSGFTIYEQGARASALGGAQIAGVNNPSAIFYNPAGLAQLSGLQLSFGSTVINSSFAFSGPESVDSWHYTRAKDGQFFPSHLYASYGINDWLVAGFGLYTPFGLGSKWGSAQEPWVGRQLTTNTELRTLFYNPVLSIKVADNLSLAIGVMYAQAAVTMEKSLYFTPRNMYGESSLQADGSGVGFNFGVQFRPLEGVHLGLNYRSNVTLDFKNGDAAFTFPKTNNAVVDQEIAATFPVITKASSSIKLPYVFGVGLSYDFTENLTAEADYVLTAWSSYDKLTIAFDDPVAGKTKSEAVKDYEDSYSLRFGMEYRIDPMLILRVGYAWDRHAVPDAYVEPSLPEGDRHIYSTGIGYQFFGIQFDGFYQVLLQEDRKIIHSAQNFNGVYTGLATLYGLTVGYSF